MYDTTLDSSGSALSEDDLRQLLRRLVRFSGFLEPHDHAGVRASASEIFALGEILDAGTLSQQELAERLGLEKSTVSRLAAGMQSRGWLSRVRDPENRRTYRLSLTAQGQAAARRVGEHSHAWHAHLLALLTPAERQGLLLGLAGLARVAEQLRSTPGAGGPESHNPLAPSRGVARKPVVCVPGTTARRTDSLSD